MKIIVPQSFLYTETHRGTLSLSPDVLCRFDIIRSKKRLLQVLRKPVGRPISLTQPEEIVAVTRPTKVELRRIKDSELFALRLHDGSSEMTFVIDDDDVDSIKDMLTNGAGGE